MSNKVEIISNAFILLGEKQVNDLNANPVAQAASKIFDSMYNSILGSHSWSFALELGFELSKLVDKPNVNEWTTIYQLPAGYFNIYKLRPRTNFTIVQNKIYTNESQSLKADITKYVAPNEATPFFNEMLEYVLAGKIAVLVTRSLQKQQYYQKEGAFKLSEAKVINDNMMPNPYIKSRPIYQAHFAG